jgi:hypothetical protein
MGKLIPTLPHPIIVKFSLGHAIVANIGKASTANSEDQESACAECPYMRVMWVLSLYFKCIFSLNLHIMFSGAVYHNISDWGQL